MSQVLDVGEDLRGLILGALDAEYSSISPQDGIVTGNHYQSIKLGELETTGFRSDRAALMDRIDFEGKKVLDLGSNLGELSRAARARGASLVDGFEYDPYFVRLANLINAYNGITRVSFHERDIGKPGIYEQHYDIVLAFAVYTYIHGCIPRIAELANVIVLETHKLHGNFDRQYVEPVARHFPSYRVMGETDWGLEHDDREIRAVVVFAKDESHLRSALRRMGTETKGAVSHPRSRAPREVKAEVRLVDVERTCLQKRFFENFRFDSQEELLAAVDGLELDVASIARSHDARIWVYSGWVYWLLFLKGYLQYSKSEAIGPGNVFFEYLTGYYGSAIDYGGDPEVRIILNDPEEAVAVVRRRFDDMDLFRNEPSEEAIERIEPIRVYAGQHQDGTAHDVFESGRRTPLFARGIDGWHRMFAARMFGAPTIRAEIIQGVELSPIRGSIEDLRVDGDHLHLRGWCVNPAGAAGSVELRARGKGELAVVTMTARPDVQAAFKHVPHATRAGFDVEFMFHSKDAAPVRFDIVALREWAPVGRMTAYYLPGMFDDLTVPPADLAKRLHGESGPNALGPRSLKVLHEILEPVKRYRSLSLFESALDLGSGCGLLELFAGRLLPNAQVTALEFDREAVDWCRTALSGDFLHAGPEPPSELADGSVDIVLGYSVMPRLTREGQRTWLSELNRVMTSGAYAALTVRGELERPFIGDASVLQELDREGISDRDAREAGLLVPAAATTFQTRDYTIEECGEWFDVLAYVEGGVNDQQDVIVLRKS